MLEQILKDHELYVRTKGHLGKRANLQEDGLRGSDLRSLNLEGRDFRGANFNFSDLRGVNLKGANLEGASFSSAKMQGANFEGCNMERVVIVDGDLREANLKNAILEWSDFEGSNLNGADLTGAKIQHMGLQNVTGDGRFIRSTKIGGHKIAYTRDILYIGEKGLTIEKWLKLEDQSLDDIAPGRFLRWWNRNGQKAINTVLNTNWD